MVVGGGLRDGESRSGGLRAGESEGWRSRGWWVWECYWGLGQRSGGQWVQGLLGALAIDLLPKTLAA